jgi:hypothetical protein
MRRPLTDSEAIGAAAGSIVALCIGGILGSVRGEISQANAALILVLVIVGAAVVGGRWAGGATALAAAVSFDFFLTRPYLSLAIKDGSEIVTTILLFVVGVAVGQIVGSRQRAKTGERTGKEEVAGLHRIARLVTEDVPDRDLIAAVEDEVAEVLLLPACTFHLLPPDPPRPMLDPAGRVDAPYVHLDDGFALPAAGVTIAVRASGSTVGWLVCDGPTQLVGVAGDRRRTALVMASLLGSHLARRPASSDAA